jgi:Flp pilus assembly protein TadG
MVRFKSRTKEQGQSLVEFALSLTILLFLVVGIVDVARALFTYLSMRDAAQEGALFASFTLDKTSTAGIDEIVQRTCEASDMLENLDCQSIADCSGTCDVSVDVILHGDACMETGAGTQNDIEVLVSYDHFPLTMPLIGELVGADGAYTIPISASIIDTIIAPDCP